MAELTPEERIKQAVSLITQSPPGEVNDVVNNIRAIVGDDDALMPFAVPALREYNLAQLHVVEHAEADGVPAHTTILSEALIVPGTSGATERFYDHDAGRSFVYDHAALVASDYEPIALPEADNAFRVALAESLGKYARNHFPQGIASVSTNQLPLPSEKPKAATTEETAASAAPAAEETAASAVPAAGETAAAAAPAAPAADAGVPEAPPASGPPSPPPVDDGSEERPWGMHEEEPTPAAGDSLESRRSIDEVDAKGGIERLDEEVAETAAASDSVAAAKGAGEGPDDPVERHPAGIAEAESTPVAASLPLGPKDEVDAPGALETLDEDVAEAQVERVNGQEAEVHERKEAEALAHEDAEDAGPANVTAAAAAEARQIEEERDGNVTPRRASVDASAGGVAVAAAATAPAGSATPYEPLANPTFTLEIVGNRFNASNFWTGRWRTRWVVDRDAGSVDGEINVDVHYFEQGNVQLATAHRASFPLPSENDAAALASAIVTNLARIETEYQLELSDVYTNLSDKAFRSLRRALPVTRQKVDWDKVAGYSIGSDISKAFA